MSGRRSQGSSLSQSLPAFVIGLLLGGLAGAAVMLLLAPRSGEKTRSRIEKQGAKLRYQATEVMDDVVTEVDDKAHQVTDTIQKGVTDLQQDVQDLIAKARK